MKPFQNLTRLGRLRRMRQLGEIALERYALGPARLVFLQYEGNVVFRVDALGASRAGKTPSSPDRRRYVLRIHTTRNTGAMESELAWLAVMRNQGGLAVPEPVPARDGKLYTTVSMAGDKRDREIAEQVKSSIIENL